MNFIRSFIFYFFFYTWTTCYFVLFSPVRFFNIKLVIYLSSFWTRTVIKLSYVILGIDYKITGLKNIPTKGKFIVASNHQSAWETFLIGTLFPGSVFILKNELRKIPIFSMYFKKLGFIFVKRNQVIKSLKLVVKSVRELSKEKNVFVIFPEGTRINPDDKVKLNSGVFAIHEFTGIPILPIKHDSGNFWVNKKFVKKNGIVNVEIFPLIKNGTNKDKLIKTLEKYYYS